MNKDFENDIKSLLIPKTERDRKQVALFLPPHKIEKLDELVKELSQYSNGRVNRNVLIEKAVDNLIKVLPNIIQEYEKAEEEPIDVVFDTIVCPSMPSGLSFIEHEHKWQYIKVDAKKIPFIKYIALYVGAPLSAIMVYAEVERFELEVRPNNQKQYIVHLKGPIHHIKPIKLGDLNPVTTRGIKYTTLDKLLKAKEYSDILS